VLPADPGLAGPHIHDDRPGPGRSTARPADAAADGPGSLAGPIRHHDAGSPYTSIALTERAPRGRGPSAGSVGDANDTTPAESVIGLGKTELITPRGPWRTAAQVELATLEYVDWSNHRRIYAACADIPPAELETAYYRQKDCPNKAAMPQA
jgi:putative transposase